MDENNINTYCFLLYKGDIIFKENKDHPKFLLKSEAEKLGVANAEMLYIGTADGNDYYAAQLSIKDNIQGYFCEDLGDIYDKVAENVYSLAIRALTFINWFGENKYCSCCGEKVKIDPNKTYMECLNCGYIIYPRLTPAIIVAVLKDDKILLARSPHFPANLYSLISGHVDPGESIETAVEREVKEEVGIEIKNIKYIGSHPWPYPYKLMFGFIAEYSSGEIQIDNNEIEAADWFSLDDLPYIPGEDYMSYARIIIDYALEARKNS